MSTITIQQVSATEPLFENARTVRKIVFIDEQKVPADEEYDEFETSSTHYLAYINNEAVGTCRFRQTEKGYKLERFAVLKDYRGKGVGSKLVESCLQAIPQKSYIYLHAQLTAMPLYKKHGFVAFGDLFYECDIAHYAMKREGTTSL